MAVGHPGGPGTLPQPPMSRCALGDQLGRPGIPLGLVFNGSCRAPGFCSLSQQHGRAWALGKENRGAGRRGEQSEEMELGAVNRFAFYGVREFISGHSPDGCNKLVKCDPPPGAGALARLLRGKGGWYSRAFPRHSSPSLACLCSTGEVQVTGTNLCLFPDSW